MDVAKWVLKVGASGTRAYGLPPSEALACSLVSSHPNLNHEYHEKSLTRRNAAEIFATGVR
ncbi:hypothetical protein Sjap_007450 [Stephania japonica]|uniref:Uncharacterized protein n=1 Tax=Stephania japonica TaxID=461633 RepID=A0AAP0PDJ8_9MAGN